MKKLLFIPLVIILMAGMCLGAACEEGPEPGSVLRVSMPGFGYESMDAIEGESFFGWAFADPLITWDENFEFIPAIAEDWTVSEDGLTWTFEIRDDVYFHNGDKLTSADVMFSIEHWQDPESWNPWSPYLSYNFDTMYCPDEYTFVYKTIKPEHPLLICFSDVRIYPKDYIETNGWDAWKEHPIASGPWEFVEFVSADHITFSANTEHWRLVPDFETCILYEVPEESTQIAMLKRGEMDVITGISIDKQVELMDEGWASEPAAAPTGVVLCYPGTWWEEAGPMHDIRVREALAYAINYEELCDTFFQGLAEPGGAWFMHPGSWGWGDDWEPFEYDLAMAQSLLADAGYPGAFDDPVINIWVQTGTAYTDLLMQVFQGYWTAAGIQTQINIVDPFEWAGMYFVPHYDDPTFPNVGAIFPWVFPDSWPSNVYHSFNMYCGGVHTCGNDPQAVVLYEKAVNEADPDLCEEYWTEFMTYANDEMFVTLGVALVYEVIILGPEVGDFTWGNWVSLWDGLAGITRK